MAKLSPAWQHWMEKKWSQLKESRLDRSLLPLRSWDSVHVQADGQKALLFSSNDYLGMACHPGVREEVAKASQLLGMGPRGSALVCGHTELHEALQAELAELKQSESALLFPTGYAANLACLTALTDSSTAIFSDSLNHASIIDGCRLAKANGAELIVYPHNDMAFLEQALRECRKPRKLVVTDALFSMDGDLAEIEDLAELRKIYGFMLMLDEAHSTLLYGKYGGGLAEAFDLQHSVDIHMGTLSKSFGAQGGFVATSKAVQQILLSRGRSYVYSTSLPIPIVVAARAAMKINRTDPGIRTRLMENIALFSEFLGLEHQSPIFALIIGDEAKTLEASKLLLDSGIHATGIRPPTVPKGTSRIRIAISAAHTREDMSKLMQAIRDLPSEIRDNMLVYETA